MPRAYLLHSNPPIAGALGGGLTITSKGSYANSESIAFYSASTDKTQGDNGVQNQFNFGSGTPGESRVFRLFVVRQPLGAGTVIETLQGVIGVAASGAPAPDLVYGLHIHAWISQGVSNAVRGTVVNNYQQTPEAWPALGAEVGRAFSAPCSAVTPQAGDLLVVEVAVKYSTGNGAPFIFYGSKDSGGALLPDLTAGAFGSTGAGWFEYQVASANIDPDPAPQLPPSIIVDDPKQPTQPWDPQCAGGGLVALPLFAPTRENWCS